MIYNIVLDRLPSEYKGYLIRTDFRIGIMINNCLSDNELTQEQRILSALSLLFGAGIPRDNNGAVDFKLAYSGLVWFLSCGQKEINFDEIDNKPANNEPDVMDFNQDIRYIYSAFVKCYNKDLCREKMHWFEFIALLNDISDCMMTSIIDIRTTDTKDIAKEHKNKFMKLKRKYEIDRPVEVTEQQVKNKKRFEELLGK